ncbi:hypothetical protein HYH02_014533 [Chlamydomonas schloesseri]|uniref:histidine--tRNA ligase n=1 Tax=Chlamydomonas schloesseri TaxID=2026947 RepID=A0A835SXJ4_9CHLO|nr:hypothetical protein HYH02_014533 [Chlamydomonas schloesseri]|eukprot:KAG2427701.1 hypothetical protein HYH02_014533 [Chlamydomonas schloesseri]
MSQKPFTVGGIGAQPSLDDVVKIAQGGLVVALDAAGAERIKKESPAPKAFQPEAFTAPAQPPAAGAAPLLDAAQTRAVLATRLLTVMNGRSGARLQVADFLTQLLNRPGLLPALPAAPGDAAVLGALADACHGAGLALKQQEGGSGSGSGASASPHTSAEHPHTAAAAGGPLADALAAAGVAPPGLSAAERAVLSSGASAAAGVGALAVAGGKRLLSAATAAAALSVEALGAPTKAFEADVVEAAGYKGAIGVADELQGLLEGSKRADTFKDRSGDPAALAAFAGAPQRLGALGEALAGAYTAVRSEVQSGALAPKGTAVLSPPSPLLPSSLVELCRALLAAARDALARARAVAAPPGVEPPAAGSGPAATAAAVAEAVAAAEGRLAAAQRALVAVGSAMLEDVSALPSVQAALAANGALQAALEAVALEAVTAVVALRALEGPPAPPAAEAAEPAPAAPAAPADGKGKAAAAAGGKKDRKGGAGGGVVLGKGTALLRAYVERAAVAMAHGGGGKADGVLVVPPLTPPAAGAADGAAPAAVAAVAASLPAAWCGACQALQPHGPGLAKFLEELRGVVEANQARRKPKVPKGARDFLPEQMAIRERAFAAITGVFKRHGAVSIDTPVFELRETLMGKYGEDSKLIYDLADQGGEILSLRYDLTVPFARFVAVQGITNIKRYHIGKVYRRDQPQMTRGRFREFFQCDFDIAGSYSPMVPDAEVVAVLVEILTELRLGQFEVKLNHRGLLDAMLAIAGVPAQKFRPICSAIDKLDKEPWEVVKAEMVNDKGLPEAVADTIGQFVVLRGEPMALLARLSAPDHPLAQHPQGKAALDDLKIFFEMLQAMGRLGPVTLDLSLARGLDYYTGVIYEAVLQGAQVGSIAAGGRYDRLVGMFSGKDVPAVGVSIGIERVFAIMEAQMRERAAAAGKPLRAIETEVLVGSIGSGLQQRRMGLCAELWGAGIKAEFGYKPNPKMADNLGYCHENQVPFMVLFGEDEVARRVVKIKDMDAHAEEEVPVEELVPALKAKLAAREARLAAEAAPAAAPAAAAPEAAAAASQ